MNCFPVLAAMVFVLSWPSIKRRAGCCNQRELRSPAGHRRPGVCQSGEVSGALSCEVLRLGADSRDYAGAGDVRQGGVHGGVPLKKPAVSSWPLAVSP